MKLEQSPLKGIMFICGSLKPGGDGIGDYSRRLACDLIKKGYDVSIMAYNDRSISEHVREFQYDDDVKIEVLRLPAIMVQSEKLRMARDWMNEKNPQCISIQYVLYAFNDRGLPFGFASDMNKICGDRDIHIMFHELWLGMERKPLLKDRLYGYLQEYIIKSMLKLLKPIMVHTHSRMYLKLLNHHGIDARYLPIISNIPVVNKDKFKDIVESGPLKFLVFGFISPGAPTQQFAQELKNCSLNLKREMLVIFAGRNGDALNDWKKALDKAEIRHEHKGVLSVSELSDLMNESDIGISTTPMNLYEKSGSVAAMFKHGLPVLNVAVEWEPEVVADFIPDEHIIEYVPGMLKEWLSHLHKPGRKKNLDAVSEQFICDLNIKYNLIKVK